MNKIGVALIIITSLVLVTSIVYRGTKEGSNFIDSPSSDGSQEESLESVNPSAPSLDSVYTLAEVAEHVNQESCWTVINGKVYDITPYVPTHPGGLEEILRACGKDGSNLVSKVPAHQQVRFESTLAEYQIGVLE